jgi:Na+-driven multidrug efflux pump
MKAYFVCYYVIGIPLAYYLTLKTPLGIKGPWIAMTTAGALVTFIFFLVLKSLDI